ncbi:MAG: peptidoglycan DL-endopeptidase RipB [Solirubrobacteraceae bacterium]|nr:peptidoglycan DL-endopeptidase RipB [Solirubrobacteraceae bacterium]
MRKGIAPLGLVLVALAGCGQATDERPSAHAATPVPDDPTRGLRVRPHAVEPDVGLPSETQVQVEVPRDPEEELALAHNGPVDKPPTDAEVRAALKQIEGVPGARARLNSDGTATAPAGAPEVVKQMIAAANAIARTPYIWGGGHARVFDRGYDCSGSLSFAFIHAGLLNSPIANGWRLMGDAGPGKWVTVFSSTGHVWMIVAGLRYDTSALHIAGSRWTDQGRSTAGFVQRHLPGL